MDSFPLYRLPTEIVMMVYDHAVTFTEPIILNVWGRRMDKGRLSLAAWKSDPSISLRTTSVDVKSCVALMQTCQDARDRCWPRLYGLNLFQLNVLEIEGLGYGCTIYAVSKWLYDLGSAASLLKNVELVSRVSPDYHTEIELEDIEYMVEERAEKWADFRKMFKSLTLDLVASITISLPGCANASGWTPDVYTLSFDLQHLDFDHTICEAKQWMEDHQLSEPDSAHDDNVVNQAPKLMAVPRNIHLIIEKLREAIGQRGRYFSGPIDLTEPAHHAGLGYENAAQTLRGLFYRIPYEAEHLPDGTRYWLYGKLKERWVDEGYCTS